MFRHPMPALILASVVLCATAAPAQERPLGGRTVSVAMFKNGLALVEHMAKPAAAGAFQLKDVPKPIHGTFWIAGADGLSAEVAVRNVKEPRRRGVGDLQRDLAGRSVTVYLQDVPQPVAGIVREFKDDGPAEVTNPQAAYTVAARASQGRFLILDTEQGEAMVDIGRIVHLESDRPVSEVTRRRAVLLLNVGKEAAGKELRIRYLTAGLSWAPSYTVDLLDKKRLRIHQNAVIRNELADLKDTELLLISGFPNVRFRHVVSPLSPETNWTNFFSQINRRASSSEGALGNNAVVMQQGVSFRGGGGGASGLPIDLSAAPSGDGVDLHYESVGRRSLSKHGAMHLDVVAGEADYRRIVEWIIPDNRDARGRHLDQYRRRNAGGDGEGDPWDALQFRNPLPLPMTTGPATITQDGRFNGQSISYWVSRGEQTTLKVTKALNIRTLSSENEKPDSRDVVYIAGNDYHRVRVAGTISVSNHRAEPVDMVIRRRFSGELVRAEGEPRSSLREEGVYSVNRRNELTWSVKLEPGETTELEYEYRVLVDR